MLKQKWELCSQELTQTTSQMEGTVAKLKSDLQTTRGELSEQRKEMSRLKQENLTKDFKIHELKRCLREKKGNLEDVDGTESERLI